MATITTRAGKGSPLTNNEVDANFNNLNSDKIETSAIGTTVQGYSSNLTSWSAVLPSAKQDTISSTGLLKGSGGGSVSAAVPGTDYQAPLVSGTNIKTVNGNSILGSGDVSLVAATGGTASGLTLSNGFTEQVYNFTGTELNPANGSIQTKTLSANTTFTDALASGQSLILGIDDGTGFTVTWPTITWTTTQATAPTLPTSGYLWVVLWKVGTTLYGKY